jgi:hypothetical protein
MRSLLLLGLLLTATQAAAFEFRGTTGKPEHSTQQDEIPKNVPEDVIKQQNKQLLKAAAGVGYGPQSPRDITQWEGSNMRVQTPAPLSHAMDLCNIHLHRNAEHKGPEFNTYAGTGDGKGNYTVYRYSGSLSKEEQAPLQRQQDLAKKHNIKPGDTIEIHAVFSTADVEPGKTLAACENHAVINPQLRVEAFVAVLVNDHRAADLVKLTKAGIKKGHYQPLHPPFRLEKSVTYLGSTTGPGYNTKPSEYQVTWHVHPKVMKINIASVLKWLESNDYEEHHLHGVRNLVTNPALLSEIKAEDQKR